MPSEPQIPLFVFFVQKAVRSARLLLGPVSLIAASATTVYMSYISANQKVSIFLVSVGALAGLASFFYLLEVRRISLSFRGIKIELERVWSPQVEAEKMQLQKVIDDIPELAGIEIGRKKSTTPAFPDRTSLYIRGIELENIRCFRRFALAFEDKEGPFLTTILLGDNAAGKSTVLRSIALALCPESDAISLMKEVSGSFLRNGTKQGSIVLHVRSIDRSFIGSVRITIEHIEQETVRQTTDPPDFPWDRIFVCGYGTHRSSGRPSSHEKYISREAVRTLFSDSADLLNPEIVLLRRDPKTRERLERILKQILLLENPKDGIHTSPRGVELEGPWGAQPITAVSDGYRSTSQWVLDYLGWQLFADRFREDQMDGVLLIDELEQHIHPRWQRYLIQRLRSQLGGSQMIASSHTPLLAAGVADLPRSQVLRLIPLSDGSVGIIQIPPQELTGKRADQILADAFGLITSKSPGSVAKIDRYTELMSKEKTNQSEKQELATLEKELADSWSSGDHALTREADKAVSKVLDNMLTEASDRKVMDAQVKQRLKALFDDEGQE